MGQRHLTQLGCLGESTCTYVSKQILMFLVLTKYYEQCIKEGVITEKEFQEEQKKYEQCCEEAFESAKKETHTKYKDWLDSLWTGFFEGNKKLECKPTGIPEATLVHIGKKFSNHPPPETDFVLHKGKAIKETNY